ncbi:hypothetical protein JCM8547_007331 [Rhodosporidiobolus lusitaniae]
MTLSGKCLCGASSITIDAPRPDAQIKCHCTDCQLTSGTAFSSNALFKELAVDIKGDIGTFSTKGASGNPVTRTFCKTCGTPFAHNSAAFGDSMAVQTGPLALRDVPYAAELFVKDRWSGEKAVEGADQKETV